MWINKSLLVRLSVLLLPVFSFAQEDKKSLEVYGFILVDGGYNFNSMNPDWFDVMRPTKLPRYKNEFGTSGNYFLSVRQTRVGVRSSTKTKFGELKTQFDFDFYGFGKDAGQTTIHLVNGFAQLGKLLVGQTPSTIMDTDVFPVTLDYWGPCSRIFLLNVQVRYTPVFNEKQRFAIGLERPGATADGYDYTNSVDSRQLKPRLPLPNLTAHYRRNWNWGYTRIAAIAKSIQWQNISDTSSVDLSGKDIGWGVNVSTVVDVTKKIKFKFQGEWGEGFQNHIADPSPDVALQSNPANASAPARGKALPVWGFFSFAEYKWSGKLQSSIGYSMMQIKNSDLQSPDAFRMGQYALFNLRYYAVENLMVGIEYQYGRRDNFSDGFHSGCHKIQFAFKCNFSKIFIAE
jgi:hypothetical protein